MESPAQIRAIITTPHSGKERRKQFVLQRIDSQRTLEPHDPQHRLIRMDSESSLTIDSLKKAAVQQQMARRREKGLQEMDRRIKKSMEGKVLELPLSRGDLSGSTWMNSSLMLDCNSSISSNTVSSSCCCSIDEPEGKRVTFGVAEIREYKVTVAVNHSVDFAMTLDWDYSAEIAVVNLRDVKEQDEISDLKPLNRRKRQQRLLAMGIPKSSLIALERRRRVMLAGEWVFGNSSTAGRPHFADGKILDYAIS